MEKNSRLFVQGDIYDWLVEDLADNIVLLSLMIALINGLMLYGGF